MLDGPPCLDFDEHSGSCAGYIPGGEPGHSADGNIPRGVGIMGHEALKPGQLPHLSDVYHLLAHDWSLKRGGDDRDSPQAAGILQRRNSCK